MKGAVPLQGPEVVGVTEFAAKLLEAFPIIPRGARPDAALEKLFQIGGDLIVVKERVVHVEEEHRPRRRGFFRGFFCQRAVHSILATARSTRPGGIPSGRDSISPGQIKRRKSP